MNQVNEFIDKNNMTKVHVMSIQYYKDKSTEKGENEMTAQEMFEKLGFLKNTSECYDEKHILYEKFDEKSKDILTVEFVDEYFVYTSTLRMALKTRIDLLKAITQQMKDLGWL